MSQISGTAAGSGFLNAAPDSDGKMRRVPLVIEYGNRYYPSLAFAAVKLNRGVSTMQLTASARGASRLRMDNQLVPLEGPSLMRLRFRGPRRTFPYVSAADVLAGRVPAEKLRAKIAIIGGSALGVQSPVVTPVDAVFPDVKFRVQRSITSCKAIRSGNRGDAQFWMLALAFLALASSFLLVLVRSFWGTQRLSPISKVTAWAPTLQHMSRPL